jgi:4-hydroxy-tetrahydrodipicolinate synthase
MNPFRNLAGVYAASITPLHQDFSPDLDAIPQLLDFLARRGCHGALMLGTTGEGPSFAFKERLEIFRAALAIRQVHPEFRLLAGTGTPSLEETKGLTKAAFDLGMDGVVVLPPYYFRKVSDAGLFAWFNLLLQAAVPAGGALFGYHIPPMTGVPLSVELLARLKDAHPERFAGIKDSSGDAAHAQALGERFSSDLVVFNGNDRLFSLALQSHASGCITAMSNLFSPDLRQVWEAFKAGQPDLPAQSRLDACRAVMDRYPPAPPLLKALLNHKHQFPVWSVRPPLLPLPQDIASQAEQELASLLLEIG